MIRFLGHAGLSVSQIDMGARLRDGWGVQEGLLARLSAPPIRRVSKAFLLICSPGQTQDSSIHCRFRALPFMETSPATLRPRLSTPTNSPAKEWITAEISLFLLLGVLGGIVGALFVKAPPAWGKGAGEIPRN